MKKEKILPPKYFIGAIFLAAVIHFILPVLIVIHFPWNLFGLPFTGIGGILNLAADKDFKKFKTTIKPFEFSNALITQGVFHISRNPMYLGMTVFLFGEAILLGSITPFLIPIIFGLLMNSLFIKTEEKMLREKFGKEYLDYTKKVRRWI